MKPTAYRLLFALIVMLSLQGCAATAEALAAFGEGYNQGVAASGGTNLSGKVGYLKGEQITGMTKQCYYDHLGSMHTKTVNSWEVCQYMVNL